MVQQQPFVLIVEDDDSLRTAIARNLQANGYLVFQAANFGQALDEMAVKPNLMILDINLPDASGWDVADWLEVGDQPGANHSHLRLQARC